jgi:oxygen-independent coproporphyrinogen-3 oxidase
METPGSSFATLDTNFDTLYFGGGTPSLIDIRNLQKILADLEKMRGFSLQSIREFTYECNPEDVHSDYLRALKELGVTKIALGIQSTQESGLQKLERLGSRKVNFQALELALEAGFAVVSADFIFGRPGQTLELALSEIAEIVNFGINHCSCYELTLPQNHKLKQDLPSDDLGTDMFVGLHHFFLEKGWSHYEISNYAADLHHVSRHNSKYWALSPYLGLGPGAFSRMGINRFYMKKSLNSYLNLDFKEKNFLQYYINEIISARGVFEEYLIGALRMSQGISLEDFPLNTKGNDPDFKLQWESKMDEYLTEDYFVISGKRFELTLQGMLHSDTILEDLSSLGRYFF